MDRMTRGFAAVTLAALAGMGLTGCSSESDDAAPGETAAPSTSMVTTTSYAPVSGPADTMVDIPAAVAERWNALGGVDGDLGPATGPAEDVAGGSITTFERGAIVLTPAGRPFVVQGEILVAYQGAGGPAGELGFPTSDEASTDGGWISTFDNGVITYLGGIAEVELS